MGQAPDSSRKYLRRKAWTIEEDSALMEYINAHGEGQWPSLPKRAGLERSGKSCRLRWVNYLRPGIKRGKISPEEEELIKSMHRLLGNRWSLIAGRLPGRTDNEIKNYWKTHMCKRHVLDKTICFDKMKEIVSNIKGAEMKSGSPIRPKAVRPLEVSVTDHHSDQLIKNLLLSVDSDDFDTSNLSLDFFPPLPPPEFSTNFTIEECEIKDVMILF